MAHTCMECGMTPLQRQDLIFLAKELPKIDFLNHEEQVLTQFGKGRWQAVNKYILFVHQLDHSLRQNESRRATLMQKLSKCTSKVKLWLRTHLNNLNQTV